MINANELRIGNMVCLIALDQKIKIESISKVNEGGLFTWIYNSEEYEDSLSAIEPIPLTPDILEKCGFVKDNNDLEFHDPDFCSWHQREFPVVGMLTTSSKGNYLFDEETDTLRIQYLHQLQNLYYSLTNSELQINL